MKVAVLTGKGPYRGADRVYPKFGPWTLPLVMGSMYKKKNVRDLGLNQHTAATMCKEVLTPPPPLTHTPHSSQKGGTWVRGGGSKPNKSLGYHFLSKNIYKGPDILYHTLGHATRMTPKEGGGDMAPAPALGLTTLFQVISKYHNAAIQMISGGGHGPRCIATTACIPMQARVLILPPCDDLYPSHSPQEGLVKISFSKNFQLPPNNVKQQFYCLWQGTSKRENTVRLPLVHSQFALQK